MDSGASTIRICHTIIQQAIIDGASEAVVEPQKENVSVRYWVNGKETVVMDLPKYVHESVIARFKQMADIDDTETELTQRGEIPILWEGQNYLIQVLCQLAEHGEKVSMTIVR